MKIKKGDKVKVMAGKDKNREGVVEKVFSKKRKVLVSGINIYKKHTKPAGPGRPGGIIDIARPLPIESVALICPACNQPTRVGYRIHQGKKVRICKKCQKEVGK